MGIIIAKFRKKKSTYEVLEKLEGNIISIVEFKKTTEESQKKIVRRFLVLAFFIYIMSLGVLYLNFSQFNTNQKILCLVPLLVIPFVIWFIKRILTWYYNRRLSKNEKKLSMLREEKKKIIDNVMETETYKVAKKILDKFANEPKKNLESTPIKALTPVGPTPFIKPNESGVRQRYVPVAPRGRISFGSALTPIAARQSPTRTMQQRQTGHLSVMPGTPMPLARSILPRDRSVLDKMVDYLVGDGPSNRYALICRQCATHNGMALREEFEYVAFKCCYCTEFNPARKKKPSAPKLEFDLTVSTPKKPSSTSESEKNSDSDISEGPQEQKILAEARGDSPDIGKMSDFDKLSDLDVKGSDTESSPMEVDDSKNKNAVENLDGVNLTNEDKKDV